MLTAYQVIFCSCDGGRIGKTWTAEIFLSKKNAEEQLARIVKKENDKELARTDSFCIKERERAEKEGKTWGRLYEPGTVENIQGWCNWCYGTMYYLKEIEIHD